jgi:hypothetical protein
LSKINRLLSGTVIVTLDSSKIFVRPFSLEDKLISDDIYQEIYDDCFLSGGFTNEELESILYQLGFWSDKEEKELESLEDLIEQAKVDYFLNFLMESKRKHIKYNLDIAEEKYKKLLAKKSALADKTCEYTAHYAKLTYLIENSSYIDNKIKIDENVDIFRLINKHIEKSLSESEIRGIAKSNEWKSIWNTCKNPTDLFKPSAYELTNEQVVLISWSRMYDNIHESPDCPPNEVIDDDIAMDGWMIHQSRKRKEEDKDRQKENLLTTKAKEVFIPVKNQQEQKEILSLNNAHGKSVISSIKKDVEERGVLNEMELTHVRQEIQMEANKRRK